MRKGGSAVIFKIATVAALSAATAVVACGGSEDGRQTAVRANDPAVAFAPLVRLAGKERTFPIGAAYFIAHSGLEWAGGPCGNEIDVTPSAELDPGEKPPLPVPPLRAARLGHEPVAYRFHPQRAGCKRYRPEVFTTAQRTRPFDTEDRPAGLRLDEGFNLDLARAAESGERRLGPDGSLIGVPAYYALERTRVRDQAGIRLSYWLLFGREDRNRGSLAPELDHEGDWERIDVLVQRGPGAGRFTPTSVEYHVDDRSHRVAWEDVESAGSHPVAYLDAGFHSPRPSGECEGCTNWKTWRMLRDVRQEAWWGYGGGWGAIGFEEELSGPSGPSPFVIGGASP